MEYVVRSLDHLDAYYAACGRGKVRFTAPLFAEVEWDSDTAPAERPDYSGVLDMFKDLTQGLDREFTARIESEVRIRERREEQKKKTGSGL